LTDWRVQIGGRWSSNQGYNDSGSLIMESDIPPDDGAIYETTVEQCLTLVPGEKFQLKAKFKAEMVLPDQFAENAKIANRVNVIWYESKNCTTGGQFGGWVEPKNIAGWQNLLQTRLIPAFGAHAVKIVVAQNGRYSRGYKAYWDDIAFYVSEVDNTSHSNEQTLNNEYTLPFYENYIKNGGFNRDLLHWHVYKTTWSRQGNIEPGSARVSFSSEKSGYGTGAMSQCVNIGEYVKYELGASLKKDDTSTQSGSARIRVSWNNKEDCMGRSKTDVKHADYQVGEGWQNLQVKNLIAPKNTRSVRVELIQSIAGPGQFSLFWDDVYFKADD